MGKREAEGETEGEAEESLIHRESTEHMHAHQAGSACKSYHNKRSAQALSSLAHTQSSAQYTQICACVCVCVCICAWWCTKCTSRSAYACRRFGTLFVNGSEIEHTHAHSTKRSHHLPGACCWLAVRSARVCPLPLSSLSCCRVGSSSSSSSSSSSTASSRWVLFMIPLHR